VAEMRDVGIMDGGVDSLVSRLKRAIPELLERANVPGLFALGKPRHLNYKDPITNHLKFNLNIKKL
jgi:hypothetical protein